LDKSALPITELMFYTVYIDSDALLLKGFRDLLMDCFLLFLLCFSGLFLLTQYDKSSPNQVKTGRYQVVNESNRVLVFIPENPLISLKITQNFKKIADSFRYFFIFWHFKPFFVDR
jgi:hypothetical protein